MSDVNPGSGAEALAVKVGNLEAALKQERGRTRAIRDMLGAQSIDEAAEKLRALKAQADEAETLRSQIKELQGQEYTPDEKDEAIAALYEELRGRDFSDAWKSAANEAGVDGKYLDSLLKLSDLSPPEEGDITGELFGDFLKSAKEAHPWAFPQPTTPPPSGQNGNLATPGVTGNAGAPAPRFAAAPAGPGVVRGAPEPTRPVTTGEASRAAFEATRGPGANPFRIA
jgi:hypothetical protein